MLHFCNIYVVDFFLHNFNVNICSLRDWTAVALAIVWPSHCSMLVWRVGWSYWAGAGHEVAGPPGCTAALVWAAPPTPHNLLSITFSIQSGTCLYEKYIYFIHGLYQSRPLVLLSCQYLCQDNMFACPIHFWLQYQLFKSQH